ncbi:MAG: hypothetical protein M3R15_17420 [Acidobacteriota bacterium]|nr:hypothetical protein [Acidobacteriota bacterium]
MSTDRTTEILNYLSAMSRDVGELRAEVRASGQGLEELRAEVRANGQGIEELRAEMRVKFNEVNTQFDGVRADIRHLTRKIDLLNNDSLDLRAYQRDLEARMDNFESKRP